MPLVLVDGHPMRVIHSDSIAIGRKGSQSKWNLSRLNLLINIVQCTCTLTCKYISIKFILFIFQNSNLQEYLDTLIHRTIRIFGRKKYNNVNSIILQSLSQRFSSKFVASRLFSKMTNLFIGDNMSIPGSHNGQLVIITLDDKCA